MVTTIKITCDGVFIQSNSYLTNSHSQHMNSVSDHNNNSHSIGNANFSRAHNHHHHNNANVIARSRRNSFSSEKDNKFTLSFVNPSPPPSPHTQLPPPSPIAAGLFTLRNQSHQRQYSGGRGGNSYHHFSNNFSSIRKNRFLSTSTSSLSSAASLTSSSASPSPPTTTSHRTRALNAPQSALLSASTSSLLFLTSPISPAAATPTPRITGAATSNIDADVKRNRRERERKTNINNIPRRNSTGNCFIYNGNGMNSHTAAINLQSSGQTAVVGGGHHRGFPSSVVTSTTTSTDDCPWFMQSGHQLQMPPTAPTRQHKRPAPQPNQNMNSIHSQVHNNSNNNNNNQITSSSNKITIIPTINQQTNNIHTPKSPNQHNNILVPPQLPPSHGIIQQQQQQQQQNSLMSTSLNSGLLQNHNVGKINLHPVSINNNISTASLTNSGNAASISLSTAPGPNMPQQPNLSMNHIMSSSLHSNSSQFDSNGVPWNNVSSLTKTGLLSNPAANAAAGVVSSASTNSSSMLGNKKSDLILNAMPWFHGKITRDDAENLLQPREDGLFLVRESTNFVGDYTLCVCFQSKVDHYRIQYKEDNKWTIDDEEFFPDLQKLVEHYENDADGLCTQLKECVPKASLVKPTMEIFNGRLIDERELDLKEFIGKGEFSDVRLGILDNEKVAVKSLKDSVEHKEKFLAEASVMTTLKHENLVKFIGLVKNSKNIFLVTEYMSKGSLVDYLRSRGRQHITKKDQINFAYDTCAGMGYLEEKKVIHRDLAARNVLIAENCVAKVSDFGLAKQHSYNEEVDVGKLPIKWTAPEALKSIPNFSNKSDMWSFGILLWEIYSFGRVPYPRIPLADVVRHVEVGYRMEAPEGCPPEVYEMMTQAWTLEPKKRPSFKDLICKLAQLKLATT